MKWKCLAFHPQPQSSGHSFWKSLPAPRSRDVIKKSSNWPEKRLSEGIANLTHKEPLSRNYELAFFPLFFIRLLIFLPGPCHAFLLVSLGWALSPPSFPSLFPSVYTLIYLFPLFPFSICFPLGNCTELFSSCSVPFACSVLPCTVFSLLVCVGFLLLLYAPHPAILFLLNHKSRCGRLCVDTRQERRRRRWVGRRGACISDLLLRGDRFDHFSGSTAGSL